MTGSPVTTLRASVQRGVAWKIASQLVFQITRFAVLVILARLLTLRDFGLAGMVLAFSGLASIFTDLGLGAALVQRRQLTEEDRSTAFWTSLAAGVVFSLVGVALSGAIADFYGEPSVQPLFAVFSLTFLLTALRTTQNALLMREMDFRSLELRTMAGYVAGAAAGIAIALAGGGAWAIVVQQLMVAAVGTALLWTFSSWRPRLTFSRVSLRALGGYGGKLFGTTILFYANRNVDNMLIGRFLGAPALGTYALAYNVMLTPFREIATPIRQVLFPAFARLKDEPERMGAAWLRVNRLLAAITVPISVALVVVAPDFVPVVFGERWEPAVPVVQILAWVGLLQSLQRLNGSVLQACDRAGWLLIFSVVAFIASMAAFFLGLHWGIVGVATAYAIATTFLQPFYAWLTARAAGLSIWTVAANFGGVVQATVAMAAGALAMRLLFVHEHVPPGARLALVSAIAAAIFLPVCAWREPEIIGELRRIRRQTKSSGGLLAAQAAQSQPDPSKP